MRPVVHAVGVTDKANPRFIVSSLSREQWQTKPLYEQLYCARGETENRIKEAQLELFADRTSSHTQPAAAVVGLLRLRSD
jgi:hypothetical protein